MLTCSSAIRKSPQVASPKKSSAPWHNQRVLSSLGILWQDGLAVRQGGALLFEGVHSDALALQPGLPQGEESLHRRGDPRDQLTARRAWFRRHSDPLTWK